MRYKTVTIYSFLAYLNQACNVLINLVFIRVLSLPMLGDVAIAKVWMQLMDYSHLGLRFALDRYVPIWDRDKSDNLLWLCLATTTIVSTVIISLAVLFTSNPLLIGAFVVWGYCVSITTILKNYYRALGDNDKMLYVYAISPSVPVALQAVTVLLFNFTAFLFVTMAVYIAAALYLFKGKGVGKSLRVLNWSGTLTSVRSSAVYLLVNSLVVFLSFSVDRVMLNHFGGKVALGEYSIILFGFSLLLIVPSTLAEFVFPKIVSLTVKTGQVYFPKQILAILVPTTLVVALSYVAVPVAVDIFTGYGRLSGLIQLVTIGILPYAVTPVLFHVMSALDMRRELLAASCAVLVVYTLLLGYGGMYSENILEYYTVARAGFGYLLMLTYGMFLFGRR